MEAVGSPLSGPAILFRSIPARVAGKTGLPENPQWPQQGGTRAGPLLSELPCYKMPLIPASEQWHLLTSCSAQPEQQSVAARKAPQGGWQTFLSPGGQHHPVLSSCQSNLLY